MDFRVVLNQASLEAFEVQPLPATIAFNSTASGGRCLTDIIEDPATRVYEVW